MDTTMADMTAAEDAARKRTMDEATTRRDTAIRSIQAGIGRMRQTLIDAGFVNHRVDELRAPSGMVIRTTYAGYEFIISLNDPPGTTGVEVPIRVRQVDIERDSTYVDQLTETILVAESTGLIQVVGSPDTAFAGLVAGPPMEETRFPRLPPF